MKLPLLLILGTLSTASLSQSKDWNQSEQVQWEDAYVSKYRGGSNVVKSVSYKDAPDKISHATSANGKQNYTYKSVRVVDHRMYEEGKVLVEVEWRQNYLYNDPDKFTVPKGDSFKAKLDGKLVNFSKGIKVNRAIEVESFECLNNNTELYVTFSAKTKDEPRDYEAEAGREIEGIEIRTAVGHAKGSFNVKDLCGGQVPYKLYIGTL